MMTTPAHTQTQTITTPQIPPCAQLQLAKQYLDEHCPLEFGSHQQVTHYVVYYRHLLAFFADGQHCGLANSSQFVALCGHKETPETLLLKKADGLHIELSINRKGQFGETDLAHLDDVQVETPLSSVNGETKQRIWLSFISGAQTLQPRCNDCKCFTAKDGSDYVL
ncbi:malate synthase [Pseudoalteromonas fenneropenaei]|uniref:Malate synthase n=1 Tax=Pseudoalteromonas fenneropenaei TaxID=1737459 RepID=A0ABV7CJX2_9GAMM